MRVARSASDSNLNADISFVVAANTVFLRGCLVKKPEGIIEFFGGLKLPTVHPTAIACHEAIRSDSPAHDAHGQKIGQAGVRQLSSLISRSWSSMLAVTERILAASASMAVLMF